MPFPESQRVLYAKNPLEEVICQLRFPPILRVDTEAPAQFQDRVRTTFPLYSRTIPGMPTGLPVPPQLLRILGPQLAAAHTFESPDREWSLVLTRDFLALSTKRYVTWQNFKERLEPPLRALEQLYRPAFFSRLGLRYRDLINRTQFGLADVDWVDLIKPQFLGELGDPVVRPAIVSTLRELVVRLTEGAGQVRVVHGLRDESGNQVYIIDCDFFSEAQTQTGGAIDVLNGFNKRAGRLFRWYISDRLHDAMGPVPAP